MCQALSWRGYFNINLGAILENKSPRELRKCAVDFERKSICGSVLVFPLALPYFSLE